MSGWIILLVIGFVIFLMVKPRKNRKEVSGGRLEVPENMNPDNGTSRKKSPVPVQEAVLVYCRQSGDRGWSCPNCQCENDHSRASCCVCNYER